MKKMLTVLLVVFVLGCGSDDVVTPPVVEDPVASPAPTPDPDEKPCPPRNDDKKDKDENGKGKGNGQEEA